jgi:hypothetical protein
VRETGFAESTRKKGVTYSGLSGSDQCHLVCKNESSSNGRGPWTILVPQPQAQAGPLPARFVDRRLAWDVNARLGPLAAFPARAKSGAIALILIIFYCKTHRQTPSHIAQSGAPLQSSWPTASRVSYRSGTWYYILLCCWGKQAQHPFYFSFAFCSLFEFRVSQPSLI